MKRRRTKALFGAVVATLVVAVGLAALRDGPLATDGPTAPTLVAATPGERVRVEVLNVGGVAGMARDATGRLRDAGFDVVDFGNGASFDQERPSAVVDRVGRPDLAGAVAEALGIDNVRSEPDPNLYVDVSVLLGSDWTRRGPGRDDGGRENRPWWDPRTWLGR